MDQTGHERFAAGTLVLLGEVHSGLLQHSTALPATFCERVLDRRTGEQPRRFERPISHVVSTDVLTGVDCRIASAGKALHRIVGTVTTQAMITGGHVLQVASSAAVSRGDRRQQWPYYLARPGQLELQGKAAAADLAAMFLQPRPVPGTLDLSAIDTRMIDAIQTSGHLDRRPPLRAERTRLRWAAVVAEEGPDTMALRIERGNLRTLLFTVREERLPAVRAFCADLALHDWLLSTLQHVVEVSRIGIDSGAGVTARLRPAVEHLLHLWMPAARTGDDTAELWAAYERDPGFTRQWRAMVDRVRDQLSINVVGLLAERSDVVGGVR